MVGVRGVLGTLLECLEVGVAGGAAPGDAGPAAAAAATGSGGFDEYDVPTAEQQCETSEFRVNVSFGNCYYTLHSPSPPSLARTHRGRARRRPRPPRGCAASRRRLCVAPAPRPPPAAAPPRAAAPPSPPRSPAARSPTVKDPRKLSHRHTSSVKPIDVCKCAGSCHCVHIKPTKESTQCFTFCVFRRGVAFAPSSSLLCWACLSLACQRTNKKLSTF